MRRAGGHRDAQRIGGKAVREVLLRDLAVAQVVGEVAAQRVAALAKAGALCSYMIKLGLRGSGGSYGMDDASAQQQQQQHSAKAA